MDLLDNENPQLPSRFSQIRRFPQAPSIDKVLAPYQVLSSIGHVKMLAAGGVVHAEVADRMIGALREIGDEIASGTGLVLDDDLDIYSAFMRRFAEKVGTISERFNVGRTYETWLLTDVRLWLRDAIVHTLKRMISVRKHLIKLAVTHEEVMMPAYAHMQPKRREMLSFFFLAADSRLRQDGERYKNLFSGVNVLPSDLDSQILLNQPLDRSIVASSLAFDGLTVNGFESIPDLDFLIEFSSCAAIVGIHLSQMAGELLLWATQEFGFVRLPRVFALENDFFPGRKSTQTLEVLRAKSGSLGVKLSEILNQLKGLPFGASHETNEVLVALNDLVYNLDFVLELTEAILPALMFDTKKMSDASDLDMLNRANAIEYLIEKGFAPDRAVSLVDPLAEYCRKRKRSMSDLAPGEWAEFSPAFDHDIYKYVSHDDTLGNNGPRYEVMNQALANGGQLLASDEAQLVAISDKVKSLTVEVPSPTE
jgi:argininosuccinate lyase